MGIEGFPNSTDIQSPSETTSSSKEVSRDFFTKYFVQVEKAIKIDDLGSIYDSLMEMRNFLVDNLDLFDTTYEDVNEKFRYYQGDWKEGHKRIKGEISDLKEWIKNISAHAAAREQEKRDKQAARLGVKLNELVAYTPALSEVWIHILPNKTTNYGRSIGMLKSAFLALAKEIEKNPLIKTIKGESWIVTKYPDLIKSLGFNIKSELLNKMERVISKAEEPQKVAYITREKFLTLYGGKSTH